MTYDPTARITPIDTEKKKEINSEKSKCCLSLTEQKAVNGKQNSSLFP